ncbi:methyltransferase domain-containing protein, partial [Streptomyces sp. NPDC006743]|uniref:class I SAM-dependent methyltransferase n=1 Tax=Streptomyces sp. NPDC006743 TaxID=3154480 RepID=UPI0034563E84
MTPTLVRQHLPHAGPAPGVDLRARARDWSEIQERMLVPLYEAVYERLEVGTGTRLLALGCGSGLALLMASARGAAVTGVDSCPERLALARQRLLPEAPGAPGTRARADARIVQGPPDALGAAPSAADRDGTRGTAGRGSTGRGSTERHTAGARGVPGAPGAPGGPGVPDGCATHSPLGTDAAAGAAPGAAPYTLVTAFEPLGCLTGDAQDPAGPLAAAVPLAERGAPVVLAGWGPPERCAASGGGGPAPPGPPPPPPPRPGGGGGAPPPPQ